MSIRKFVKSKSQNSLAFFNILSPIILNGISFFTIPIFSRALGTYNYGIVSLYMSWVQIFTIIVGLQTSGTIASSMTYYEGDEIHKYRSSVLALSTVSFLVTFFLVLIFLKPISKFTNFEYILIILVLLQSFGAYCVNFSSICFTYEKEAFRNFLISVFITITSTVLSLVLILGVFPKEKNYLGRVIGLAIPYFLSGIILYFYFLFRGKTTFNKEYWRFCLPLAIPLLFHGLSQIILAQTSKLALQKSFDESIVGIYALMVTVTNVLVIIYNALNNTWVPFFYEYLHNKDYQQLNYRTKNYLILFSSLTIGFMLVSPEVVYLFGGSEYMSGTKVLPLLAFSSFMTFLYSFPVNYQFFNRKTINIAIGTVMAAIFNIIFNVSLVPRFGIQGAAISTTISYVFLFIFHEIIAKKFIEGFYPYTFKTFFKPILSVSISLALCFLLKDMVIIRWILATVVGIYLLRRIIKLKTIF